MPSVDATSKNPTQTEDLAAKLPQSEPKGWVWVSQVIDLTKQLGGTENVMTLDGEPLPVMQKRRVTLGLVIDEYHIVTRLFDVSPNNPPVNVVVSSLETKPAKARFLGMDTVTGLCILKADATFQPAPVSTQTALPLRENIRLYGYHPNLNQNPVGGIIMDRPRRNEYPGQVVKAVTDFRYNSSNPIYYLISPPLTPVQDCSLILGKDNSVFGIAIYDIGSEGHHIVYPISRVQTIAQSVIKSHKSIAHGWLGINGQDMSAPIPTQISSDIRPELGVIITVIAPDSPAEIAGIKSKDILLSVNDRRIETRAQLGTALGQIPADSEISLKIKRGKEFKTLKARLVPAPATEPEQQLFAFNSRLESIENELKLLPPSDPSRQNLEDRKKAWVNFINGIFNEAPVDIRLRVFYGFEIKPMSNQLMNYFAVTNGVLVSSVGENNKAERAGLKAGDVITKVGEKQINNLAALISALDSTAGEKLEIVVSRHREQITLHLSK